MHIYFSGAGGAGIGPLALLALDAGHTVSGSDLQQSTMIPLLQQRGADIAIGQDGSQIRAAHREQPIDWFVYASALPKDHPELLFAQENGIKTSKRDEFLNYIFEDKKLKLITVIGTHGKTTTTGMLVWLFKELGIPASYSIGTNISFGSPAQYTEDSEYFIYECDEFDRNFLSFTPHVSALTSVDYDHADTYPTQEAYSTAFKDFLNRSPHTLMWQHDASHLNIRPEPKFTIFDEKEPAIQSLKMPGEHNRRNGWLAIQTLRELMPHYSLEECLATLDTFPGTNRRFEKLATNLYSDYAHHPTEIAATIQMAKEVNPNVVVVYQPHQNIRQHEIMREGGYKDSFKGAQAVYTLPIFLSRDYQDLPLLSPEDLIASTTTSGIMQTADMDNKLWQEIEQHRQNGELVLCMSAGNLDPWLREKLKA